MSKKIVGSSFAPTKEPGTIHTVRRFVWYFSLYCTVLYEESYG
jgi:hypothetical protein